MKMAWTTNSREKEREREREKGRERERGARIKLRGTRVEGKVFGGRGQSMK